LIPIRQYFPIRSTVPACLILPGRPSLATCLIRLILPIRLTLPAWLVILPARLTLPTVLTLAACLIPIRQTGIRASGLLCWARYPSY
jgi:hypothetical protein